MNRVACTNRDSAILSRLQIHERVTETRWPNYIGEQFALRGSCNEITLVLYYDDGWARNCE